MLKFRRPDPLSDPNRDRLDRLGFNHVCFAVDDIETMVAALRAHGIKTRNEIMDFHQRKLVFISGPEDITVELSEWH